MWLPRPPCMKEMNLHTERGKSCTKCKETTPNKDRHQSIGAGMQTQDTRPALATRPSWKRLRIRRMNTEMDNQCLRIVSVEEHTPFDEINTLQQKNPKRELGEYATPDLSMVTRQRTVDPTNSLAAVPEHGGTNNRDAGPDQFGGTMVRSTRPWTTPPTIIQIPLEEVTCSGKRLISGHQQESWGESSGTNREEDLRTTIDRLVAKSGSTQGRNKIHLVQPLLEAQGNHGPYDRKTDANEHRKMRHGFDIDPTLTRDEVCG